MLFVYLNNTIMFFLEYKRDIRDIFFMKETRPSTKPIPIRFSEEQLSEIEKVAKELSMSRQEIIRLATSAGIVALKKLGSEGLAKAVAELLLK